MSEKGPDIQAQPEKKPMTLSDWREKFLLEKHDFQKMNGGCQISADVNATLNLLRDNVLPKRDNLPAMIRETVQKNDAQKRSLEVIWEAQMDKGANFVGVLDGEFHFFKNEEMLPDDNVPLRISVLDSTLEFREKNIADAREAALREVLGAGRSLPWMQVDSGDNAVTPEKKVDGGPEGQGSFNVG